MKCILEENAVWCGMDKLGVGSDEVHSEVECRLKCGVDKLGVSLDEVHSGGECSVVWNG